MGRGWEKRLASVISHAPLCPSSRSSPLRSNPRFRSSLKRSRCANTSASECAARGLRLAASSQRPHSDLTATSQIPHSDLTATSQRPHSDLTATPQRPHTRPFHLAAHPLIHPPAIRNRSLHTSLETPLEISPLRSIPPPSLPPTRVSLTCVAPPPSLCSCYRTWRTISSRTWRHSPASSFSTGVVFLSLTHSILPMCHTPTLPLISPS